MSRNRLAVWGGKGQNEQNSVRKVWEEVRLSGRKWAEKGKESSAKSAPQSGRVKKRKRKRQIAGKSDETLHGSLEETGGLASRGAGGLRWGNVAEGRGHKEPCFRCGGRGGGGGGRGLTQDSVQRVPPVDSVELGGRQGAAHGPVSCGASGGDTMGKASRVQTSFPGEALPHQVCRARGPRRSLGPESQRILSAEIPVR